MKIEKSSPPENQRVSYEEMKQRFKDGAASGLYRPESESDACGVGFVVKMNGEQTHDIIGKGLEILDKLTHRGACGCDPETGDGCGILTQIPHGFFDREAASIQMPLPPQGRYAIGMVFLPRDVFQLNTCLELFEKAVHEEGQKFLGWRRVPVDDSQCGWLGRESMPEIRQIFIGAPEGTEAGQDFERKLYVIRKSVEEAVRQSGIPDSERFYVSSLSSTTIVYKGLLLPERVGEFYLDLKDPEFKSCMALVHQRFSTNTLPTWDRSHPYRLMAHNGEINTLRGNANWMRARESMFSSPSFGEDVRKISPVIEEMGSDSACFDNGLELLLRTGRSLPHAVMMMIPEAWQKHEGMSDEKKAFYEYHACLMEPWDGPASVAFTDGKVIGAILDRNGLRPSRYVVTKDGMVVMASEVGVLEIEPENVAQKSRLQPGRMFLVDTEAGRIIDDEEIKTEMMQRHPYREWLDNNLVHLKDLPEVDATAVPTGHEEGELVSLQQAFGYTNEDLKILMMPMARDGIEATGSMGTDTPLAALSDRPQLLYGYFKQLFAQVTNPPIDPIREEMVMSLKTTIGSEQNLFEETPKHCRQLALEQPILTNEELARLKSFSHPGFFSTTLSTLYLAKDGTAGLEKALDALSEAAETAVDNGATILVLSDRGVDETHAPIPALLACGAVHQHLIRKGTRTHCGLVIESGEPREVQHYALLAGYGAGAINPYLAFETLEKMIRDGLMSDWTGREISYEEAVENYLKALGKGLMKVMSKMGISTLQSYRGAQIYEAVGVATSVIDKYFTRTASRIEGIDIGVIARETGMRHHHAFAVSPALDGELDVGGQYQWRRRGEHHMYNPETVAKLQHAVRAGNYKMFKQFSDLATDEDKRFCTIRGLLKFRQGRPVPLEEVEPASEIVKRFKTGAMSLGSISREAHENLAIAMNRLGGRSNTGEGGEDPVRYTPEENGDSRRSSIKQVASGRFGVTSHYLVNSDELQIKMAQGAKPGDGGPLPGHKVDD
jgi:glutamate synthase domain-containing protein 1